MNDFPSRFDGPSGEWFKDGILCRFWTEDGITSYWVTDLEGADIKFDVCTRDPFGERHFGAWVWLGRPDRTWIGKRGPLDPLDIQRLYLIKRNTSLELRFANPDAMLAAARLAGDTLTGPYWSRSYED